MALSSKVRMIIVAPIIGLVGVGLLLAGLSDYNTASSLGSGGVEVPGKVVDMRTKVGRRNSTTYYLTVSYESKAGSTPTQREFQVSKTAFDRAEQSPEMQVRILPSDPTVAQIVGEESSGYGYMAIGAGCLVACAFMFLRIFKKDQPAPIAPTT